MASSVANAFRRTIMVASSAVGAAPPRPPKPQGPPPAGGPQRDPSPYAPPRDLQQLLREVEETHKPLLAARDIVEAENMIRAMQEYSINCVSADVNDCFDIGNCMATVGGFMTAIHCNIQPKLEFREALFKLRSEVEDINSRIQSMHTKGKVDIAKLTELQQERDSMTERLQKTSEQAIVGFENVAALFSWRGLETFSQYIDSYSGFFKENEEMVMAVRPKYTEWGIQAVRLRSVQERKAAELSELGSASSGQTAVAMSNGILQVFADTQTTYIDRLKLIVNGYLASALRDGSLFVDMSKDDVEVIFSNTPALLEMHTTMLQRLVATQSVSRAFSEHIEEFQQNYAKYLEHYPQSVAMLAQCRKKSKTFSGILKAQEAQDQEKSDLDELLTLPFDHLRRCCDFITSLPITALGPTSESQSVSRTINVLRDLAQQADLMRRVSQARGIAKAVSDWPEGGDNPQPPQRSFVAEYPVSLQQNISALLFVLSDVVLVVRKPSMLQTTLLRKQYQYVNALRMEPLVLRELSDSDGYPLRNVVDLADDQTSIAVGFESDEQRKKFVTDIRGTKAQTNRTRVFGVPLAELMSSKREKGRDVPSFVEEIFEAMLADGALDSEGIFRMSGSASEIDGMRLKLDSGMHVSFQGVSVNSLAGLLKLFLRNLPDPLITRNVYDMISAAAMAPNEAERARLLRDIVAKLPQLNQCLLQEVMRFLSMVVAHSDVNKMNARNLSIVFGPSLLSCRGPSDDSLDSGNPNFAIVQLFIENYSQIFSSIEMKRKRRTMAPMQAAAAGEITLSLRDIVKQGPLQLMGHSQTSWSSRWFILKRGYMFCFKSQKDTKALHVWNLCAGCAEETVIPRKQFCISVTVPGVDNVVLAAASQLEVLDWLHYLEECSI
eukprot:m51a1_g13842 putative domain containing protein (892) ;mRNA; f:525495-529076